MIKILKLTFLSAVLLFASVNSTNAAFPKEKLATTTVAATEARTELTDAPVTKATLKKELNNLKKENTNNFRGSGGKSKMTAALICFFLGTFGVHSFYMGNKMKGLIQLILGAGGWILVLVNGFAAATSGTAAVALGTVGLLMILAVGIWAFIDFIRILTGGLTPEEGFDD